MKNTLKKLFDTKFKKVAWFVFATIIILCAVFIRTVPNYSKKYGFEIVNLFDYNKYNQGYCLAENRILDKEELYKRAITQFLDRELEVDKKIDEWRYKNYGSRWKSDIEIGYYELRQDINLDNWLEKIKVDYMDLYFFVESANYHTASKKKSANELLFDKLKIKKINPIKYIKIDLNNSIAGFSRPILFITHGLWSGNIMLDNIIKLDGKTIKYGYYFSFDYGFSKYDDFMRNAFYDKEIENKELKKSKHPKLYFHIAKIDNCGNIDYDTENKFIKRRQAKGG